MSRIFLFTAASLVLAFPSFAQTARPAEDASAASKAANTVPKARPHASSVPQISSSSWEVWSNVIIPAGGSVDIDSDTDFSSSDTVRVTVRSANADLADLAVNAYWSVPQANYYNNSAVVTGDTFYYANVGAAMFNTYGNQFRLRLVNNGNRTMTLTQVTVFARIF